MINMPKDKVIKKKPEPKQPYTDDEKEQMKKLVEVFAASSQQDSSADIMDMIDSSDRARAFIVASLLTSDIDKIKHITQLSPTMISNLTVLGSTNKYLAAKGYKSMVRSSLYDEIITLMISLDRQGRKEITQMVAQGESQNSLVQGIKNKFGYLK